MATGAPANNPNGVNPICAGMPFRPHDVVDPAQSNPVLLHASWPFRTITAAIAYLAPVLPLPNTSATTGWTWQYAIIHLLPGRYHALTTHDSHNGLPGNGETFPIDLPDRVSIQGTSALNTMIDLNLPVPLSGGGPAFRFGFGAIGNAGTNSFIDSVSIYGAIHDDEEQFPWQGSAIYMAPGVQCDVTITNCFIFGNEVGILMDAAAVQPGVIHRPMIVNNTIVWNTVGLWNGQIALDPGSAGVSLPIVVNNIFDATPPAGAPTCPFPAAWPLPPSLQGPFAYTGFEGLASADMTITSPTPGGNFNAFERGALGDKYNFGPLFLFVPGLPGTGFRSGAGTPTPATTRNIAAYTGGQEVGAPRRGVLFIRDALCNGPFRTGRSMYDLSPHDLRLSPAVAGHGVDTSGNPWPPGDTTGKGALNPLVNNGFFWNFTAAPQTVTLANTRTFSQAPGHLPLGQVQWSWPYTSWEEDCEGFGNPRAIDHKAPPQGYAKNGQTYLNGKYVDIGADELHELPAVGYRFGTTMLIEIDAPPNQCNLATTRMDNKYLWYFGPPQSHAGTPPTTTKPYYRVVTHLPNPPTNYRVRPPWWSVNGWSFLPGGLAYYFPTYADIQPHLVPDVHPWWHLVIPSAPTNPIWQPTLPPPGCAPQLSYNASLYQDPAAGVINPPGTHSTTTSSYAWLDGQGSPVQYFPIGWIPNLGGPTTLNSFDSWCRGTDSSSRNVDTFVATGPCVSSGKLLTALRYSIEVPNSSTWQSGSLLNSNQQSFGVIVQSTQ